MLLSQLYGIAKDICKCILRELIQSEDVVDAIETALYTRDSLAVFVKCTMNLLLYAALNEDKTKSCGLANLVLGGTFCDKTHTDLRINYRMHLWH